MEEAAAAAYALVGVTFSQVDITNGETSKISKVFLVRSNARVQAIELGPNEFIEQVDSLGLLDTTPEPQKYLSIKSSDYMDDFY